MEDEEAQEINSNEVAPALIALHPIDKYIVVAVGTELRIFNTEGGCPIVFKGKSGNSVHGDAITSIAFNMEGTMLVSTGDDKLVNLWNTESWLCIKTLIANKKVSAACFSHDSKWLLYADKFGIVYVISTLASEEGKEEQPVQLLAHCCSIITSLACSSDGRFVVTADRDYKIRVSVFPKSPLKGAHEIEGFCLGHTSFVSCMSFAGKEAQLLVSGGGDGTVRLWKLETSELLDTLHVSLEVSKEGDESEIVEADQLLAVTCITVSSDASLIAVGIERLNGVIFLSCNDCKLSLVKRLTLPEHFCPTSLQFDSKGRIWMVAGAAEKTENSEYKAVTWVKVFSSTASLEFNSVKEDSLPGGSFLLETIGGIGSDREKALALAEAANVAMKNKLSKRQYTHEHLESRKCLRNDKKLKSGSS